ncbi:pentatricopeptide repeat-containing protein At4g35850, mitochondrial-like [Salvia splendens]|uniref:pentatricopeptide repeat-containing protein At4g35850, mitochondrial-like n=1 Tax=Salvia splendens TaxID=180675 RepID=UPI001C26A649|nr:pentatricopeptide repeat-containing protein At4g35850, mitochondrial-like [Salvia splendens]
MKLLRAISGNHRTVVRALGRRNFCAPAEEYAKRNYASDEPGYNTVIGSLTAQRRNYLLRDVYDDMMLDGVKPERDTFHSLIIGTMKGARIQDAFFFRDEMKAMGLVPDVALYNYLISTCGKCNNSDQAISLLEEMKRSEVKPTGQTFICLLHACAASGRVDRVYAIVRDMTAAGLGLNKFCYAGLILAHRNKSPPSSDTVSKIIELVEQSKGWSSVDHTTDIAENVMKGITEEELYNLPTAEYVHRRAGFIARQLTVYHVAFLACADLKDVQATDKLLEMLEKDGKTPDVYILMQIMRCVLSVGDLDRGKKIFEEYMKSNRVPMVELFSTLAEGAMVGYTERGMQVAQDILVDLNNRGMFLSFKMANDLLLAASGEKTGGYTVANMLWDMMQSRKMTPSLPTVEAYHRGLKEREIPEDDPRLMLVTTTLNNLKARAGPGGGR